MDVKFIATATLVFLSCALLPHITSICILTTKVCYNVLDAAAAAAANSDDDDDDDIIVNV